MQREQAETLALQVLAWLAAQDDLFQVFLGSSGAAAQDLAALAPQAEFQIAVLDFLTMDDDWVMQFCQAHNLPYEAPLQARQALPGGAQPHWT